jgi:colanic acid biosynthesis glycosyl transferase WcaI
MTDKVNSRRSAIIVHQYFFPDDDVSSRYYTQLAEELIKRNWEVTVLTSNRYCRYPKMKMEPSREIRRGVRIIRTPCPPWNPAEKYSRLANSLWLIAAWCLKFVSIPKADVVVLGSNPPFAPLLLPFLRLLKRQRLLVHWCHDLYPEAIVVDGAGKTTRRLAYLVSRLMKLAYARADLMVDLGSCMRGRLDAYNHEALRATLVPWAFVENDGLKEPDPITRHELFNGAKLGILYSGTMGRAHDFSLFLELARRIALKDPKIMFSFACRGNRHAELCAAIRPEDRNVVLGSFATESALDKRLNAADLHLLSLRPGWDGVVVPSKFFGSLAVGKPVIYAGPESSAIAQWIRKFEVGLVLTENNVEDIMKKLLEIANNKNDLKRWQENALNVYKLHFSKKYIMNQWDETLRKLL